MSNGANHLSIIPQGNIEKSILHRRKISYLIEPHGEIIGFYENEYRSHAVNLFLSICLHSEQSPLSVLETISYVGIRADMIIFVVDWKIVGD